MIKNNGCCDLKYAKKLKELGVKQEGVFCYWQNATTKEWNFSNHLSHSPSKALSAFTVAELGELLPDNVLSYHWYKEYTAVARGEDNSIIHSIWADTEANARAKMLIWLIKQGKVKI